MKRTARPAPFTIIEPTNHWVIENGYYYRDTLVREADGTLAYWLILDGPVGGQS